MRYPHSAERSVYNPKTKKQEKKRYTITNLEKRDKFIKSFGDKEFRKICLQDDSYAKLQDIPFPPGWTWLFNHFYSMWRHCECDFNGNRIFTPKVITDYCECFKVKLTVREKREVMMMHEWASMAIAELEKNNDE